LRLLKPATHASPLRCSGLDPAGAQSSPGGNLLSTTLLPTVDNLRSMP
jgi:hypothetical protein